MLELKIISAARYILVRITKVLWLELARIAKIFWFYYLGTHAVLLSASIIK